MPVRRTPVRAINNNPLHYDAEFAAKTRIARPTASGPHTTALLPAGLDGILEIALRDQTLILKANDMVVIPKGIDHKPKSIGEGRIMPIEPGGTLNTGDAGGHLTDTREEWL